MQYFCCRCCCYLSEWALELFLSYLNRMYLLEQWFSNLAVHWSWWCLWSQGFLKAPYVNLMYSQVLEALGDTALSKGVWHCAREGRGEAADTSWLSVDLPGSGLVPGGITATHCPCGCFLPLSFTLVLQSKWSSRKRGTQNDSTGTGLRRVG